MDFSSSAALLLFSLSLDGHGSERWCGSVAWFVGAPVAGDGRIGTFCARVGCEVAGVPARGGVGKSGARMSPSDILSESVSSSGLYRSAVRDRDSLCVVPALSSKLDREVPRCL